MDAIEGAYIPRIMDSELDDLCSSLPAIVIEGPRGVGKTATASRRARTIHELDDPNQLSIAEADPARLLDDPPPVLLDEWQHIPRVWDLVRRQVDAGAKPGQFLLAGSADHREAPTHSGAGRIVTSRMRPMSLVERGAGPPTVSLRELLSGQRPRLDGRTGFGLEDYVAEIMRSGFPGLRKLPGKAVSRQLDGYLRRLADREIEAESGRKVRNPADVRHWMRAFAAATSTTTSLEKIKNAAAAGGDPTPSSQVRSYRDVLERLWIIDPVPAWHPTRNHLRRIARPDKHQLADPALAARLLGVDADALLRGDSAGPAIPRDGTLLGALFEALVTLSVRVYAQAAEAEQVSHLRTRGGEHEVDLIVERDDGKIVAIEVKLGQVVDDEDLRHLRWLEGRIGDDLLDVVMVTTGTDAYRRRDGIAVVPAALLGP